MGLSLSNLTKKIEDVVGGVERQVNPLDNGATYSKPNPPVPAGAPPPSTGAQASRLGRNIVSGVMNPFAKAGNEGIALGELLNPLGTIESNEAASKKTLEKGGGIAHQGGVLGNAAEMAPEAVFIGPNAKQNIERTAGTGANIGSMIAGPEAGFIGKGLDLLPRVLRAATVGSSVNALGSVGQQLATTGHVSLAPTLEAGGTGALLSGAAPVIGNAIHDIRTGNEVGAVGPQVNEPVPAPELPPKPKVGLKLPDQASIPAEPPDFLKPSPDYVPKTPEEMANLSPKEQMALSAPPTKLNDQALNTAYNPYKSLTTDVVPGDYQHAIQNSQLVSRPIETAANVWKNAMSRLTGDERTNFWKAVEKPGGDYSPQLKQAVALWRGVDNKVHGESQALGGNTNYLVNHGLHPWQLPEEYTNHIIIGGSPSKFEGLNNISRKYRTIEEGEKAGLTLGNDPVNEGSRYLQANAAILRKQALKQGLTMADNDEASKTHTLDLGGGHTVSLSRNGYDAVKGVQYHAPSTNVAMKSLRTGNQAVKSTLLSLGQFHTINIGALRAAPTLVLRGHPVAAAKGLYGMVRGAFGTQYADRVIGNAIEDGTVDKAAQIGMPYGGSGGYNTESTFLKSGVGSKTVFGKQIPIMHDQVARSIISDLERKGVALDSPEARNAGLAGANLMGELNTELQHVSPRVKQAMSDWMLAGQFTPSKFLQDKRALTTGGVGGGYARANVAANVAATTAIIIGLGYAAKQKSDNVKDMLLRALVDPAVPTNMKDAKGNTVKLRTPGTDTSDIAKLLGMTLVRGSNGHLNVSWSPHNMPSTVEEFARDRLSPILSAGVKLATNTSYAGKPLFDPNAPAGTKAEQAAASVVTGDLPIGAQGLAYTKAVKSRLPGGVQEVLNASTPGTNPVVKSIGSSFGLTPSTDMTVGKGQQSSQYFTALAAAKKGLNRQEADALDLYSGSKKNPVTGKYDVLPTVNDQRAKATTLLQNPKVIDNLIVMNKNLKGEGQAVDPLWLQPKANIVKYLQYQAMPPSGPDQVDWRNSNPWYESGNNSLYDQRQAFFNSLPPGDPNKPKAPIEYPLPDAKTTADQNTYFGISDPAQRETFLLAHSNVSDQMDKQAAYDNALRTAQGYKPLKGYPNPSPYVEGKLQSMTGMTSKQKAAVYADPQVATWSQADAIYNLTKGAAVAQLQGNNLTSKDLSAVNSLKYDIVKNPDGSYALSGSSTAQPGATSTEGSSYGKSGYVSRTQAELENPFFNAADIDTGGNPGVAKYKVRSTGTKAIKMPGKASSKAAFKATKPKVTKKASKV